MVIAWEVKPPMIKDYYMMRRMSIVLFFILSWCNAYAVVSVVKNAQGLTVCTEYGEFSIHEPVLVDLIQCSAMERLKDIRQYGVTHYARQEAQFTRYEHSLGVFVLLRTFGACLEEQIAGLMHDVSHTVFSHVGDIVFSSYFDQYSYQDHIHEWFLDSTGVTKILQVHGMSGCCSEETKKKMRMLEQDKPDLCMDRIEYLLRGALAENLITQKQAREIIDNLYFENGLWACKDISTARSIGTISLWLTENIFGSAWNAFIYDHASIALKRALDIKAITLDDIHFSTDEVMWQTLKNQSDEIIKNSLDKVEHYNDYFILADAKNYDQHYKAKFLGVDPWVEIDHGIARLSSLDVEYKDEYDRVQSLMKKGWYIELIK